MISQSGYIHWALEDGIANVIIKQERRYLNLQKSVGFVSLHLKIRKEKNDDWSVRLEKYPSCVFGSCLGLKLFLPKTQKLSLLWQCCPLSLPAQNPNCDH